MLRTLPILLFCLTAVAQQPLFKANGYFPHTEKINELKSADLNGDGLSDLVVVTGHQLGAMIYWNQGEGQFFPAAQMLNIAASDELMIEDFDGDGDLDLWAGTINQGGTFIDYTVDPDYPFSTGWSTITIPNTPYQLLLNDGAGNFTPVNSGVEGLRRIGNPRYETVDLDCDGDKDLVTYSKLGDEITDLYLFKNNGMAHFEDERIDIELSDFVALYDYNLDGYLDIWTKGRVFTHENTQELIIYLNDGHGVFSQEHQVKADVDDIVHETIESAWVGDVTGDGRADLVLVTAGKVNSLIQQADGTFSKTSLAADKTINHASFIDNNGDGSFDLLMSLSGQGGTSLWHYNNGLWQVAETMANSHQVKQHVADDFDGDGRLDVATAGSLGVKYWQRDNQTWNEVIQTAGQAHWVSQRLVATADMNSDGHIDLLMAGKSGAYFRAGNGRGAFAEMQRITTQQVYSWAWGDINQDGQTDLAVTNENGVYLFVNEGLSGFKERLVFQAGEINYFIKLIIQDLNNDNSLELVIVNPDIGIDIYNWRNSDLILVDSLAGEFSGAFTFDMGSGKHSLMLSERSFLADSDPLTEYLLTDDGLQQNRTVLNSDFNYGALFSQNPWVFDYDKDGDNDILLDDPINSFGGYKLLINQGETFEIGSYYFPSNIDWFPNVMGDFNLDGEVDFIAPLRVGIIGWQDTILLNDGDNNNNYWIEQEIYQSPLISMYHTADIDADGDLDLLTVNDEFFSRVSSGGISTFINTTKDINFSGLWFNPSEDGHGLQLEQIDLNGTPAVNFSWFAYRDGKPFWLVGLASIADNQVSIPVSYTSGGDFGDAFDAESVVNHPWGQVDLVLNGNDLQVTWQTTEPGFTNGSMNMQRLATTKATSPLIDVINSCHSGSWYNADESGHGFFVNVIEIGGETVMTLAWYHYLNGEQKWLVSQGPVSGTTAHLTAQNATGGDFPPHFSESNVEKEDWGQLTFSLLSDAEARITWSSNNPDYPEGTLRVEKLTQLDRYHCQ